MGFVADSRSKQCHSVDSKTNRRCVKSFAGRSELKRYAKVHSRLDSGKDGSWGKDCSRGGVWGMDGMRQALGEEIQARGGSAKD